MASLRCASLMCFIVALGLCISAFAQTSASTAAGQEVALLPEAGAIPAPAPATEQPPPTVPAAEPPKQIAQLFDATPAAGSAAYLLEMAEVYRWLVEGDALRACLEEAAALSPGSLDSAKALILLGQMDAEAGLPEASERFLQAKAQCPDAAIHAFADLVQGVAEASRVKDLERCRALLAAAADTWKGSWLGGWAALRLAEAHWWRLGDPAGAEGVLRLAAQDYLDSTIGTEALLLLADWTTWEAGRADEALELYRRVQAELSTERLRLRAALGVADCLLSMGEATESYELADQLAQEYTDHPGLPIAIMHRAAAADVLGHTAVAVADARAFLESDVARSGKGWSGRLSDAHAMLGFDAFRRGDLDEAESDFAAAVQGNPDYRAKASASIANCRAARGDLRGAIAAFLDAADAPPPPPNERKQGADLFLYGAAMAASQLGDTTTFNQIIARMVADYPGSSFTTRLVGCEILPAPEL
jgi:tetratricopeptide (TPR) repeat protein